MPIKELFITKEWSIDIEKYDSPQKRRPLLNPDAPDIELPAFPEAGIFDWICKREGDLVKSRAVTDANEEGLRMMGIELQAVKVYFNTRYIDLAALLQIND
jgi:hypothetical protein